MGLTPGPRDGGMELDKSHAGRLGLARRRGLGLLFSCYGLPQVSQEGWGKLDRRNSLKKG